MTRFLANMNHQKAFDTMLNHLRQQGKPAVTEKGRCRYRVDGLKCAVGALIPDEEYEPAMEGRPLFVMVHEWGASNEDERFLITCRTALHDEPARIHLDEGTDFISLVEENARQIAEHYGLIYSINYAKETV